MFTKEYVKKALEENASSIDLQDDIVVKKIKREVNTTCPMPTIVETFPKSFRTLKSRLRPTTNKRKATPMLAKV